MEALRAFQQSAAVMVCTQNASEGLNLQFANCMVNFDLPWDPMRLEQRIGRIQRIGGKPKVFIYNLFLQDTVEQDILDVLEKKIEMFGETIGQVEEILGNLADDESFDQIFLDLFVVEDRHATDRKIDDLVNRPKETSGADQLLDAIFGDGAPPALASPRIRPEGRPSAHAACPNCGQPVQAGARFCDGCGRPAGADIPAAGQRARGGDAAHSPVRSGPAPAACRGCGAALSPGARFCDNCGMAQASPPLSGAGQARCKGCGAGLPAGASFCDGCGRKVEA